MTLFTEGLTRLAPWVVLSLLHVGSAWAFGLVFVLGQVFAALVGVVALWRTGAAHPRRVSATVPATHVEGSGRMWLGISGACSCWSSPASPTRPWSTCRRW